MIVVVGGNRRSAGKTTVVCRIIAATPEARWTAIRLVSDAHQQAEHSKDTRLYLAAGAVRAILSEEIGTVMGNVIIESNSVLDRFKPNLFLFVDGGGEWKPSAVKHAPKADIVVKDLDCEAAIARVQSMLG